MTRSDRGEGKKHGAERAKAGGEGRGSCAEGSGVDERERKRGVQEKRIFKGGRSALGGGTGEGGKRGEVRREGHGAKAGSAGRKVRQVKCGKKGTGEEGRDGGGGARGEGRTKCARAQGGRSAAVVRRWRGWSTI